MVLAFFWRVVQFVDVVAPSCCCLRCSGHFFLLAWGKGWRCWISVMHGPFYHGWHVFRQIPSYKDAAKASHWKPVKTAADSGCLLSGLRIGSQMTRLWPKTYLNGACTTLTVLAAGKGTIDAWLKEDMKWQSFSLAALIYSARTRHTRKQRLPTPKVKRTVISIQT